MTDEADGRRGPGDRTDGAAADGADPAALRAAVAATRAELAALPAPEVPPAVAARWAAALAEEARDRDTSPRAGVPGPVGRRTGPRRRSGPAWRPLLAAAALAAVVGTGLGALVSRDPPAPAVTGVGLVAFARDTVGTVDVGGLADPARRTACLRAVAPAADGEALLGGRRVVLDGRPGVLLVLATGTRGGLRIVTVDPACGAGGGTLIAQLVVG